MRVLLLLSLATACTNLPTFEALDAGTGPECSDDGTPGPCEGDQLCLDGRCFAPCASNDECSTRDRCLGGVCVEVAESTDGGVPFDAGTMLDPCGDTCVEPEICDFRTGSCVECTDSCDGELLVCDYARGQCVTAGTPAQCSPCDDNTDCGPGFSCVLRDAYTERVCLLSCPDDSCPNGYTCEDAHCVPLGSCTQAYRALVGATCTVASECVPRRRMPSPDACDVAAMRCTFPCVPDGFCPDNTMCPANHLCALP